MKSAFVEMKWARLALPVAFIVAHLALLVLVVVSMIEVFKTISFAIGETKKTNNFILIAALLTSFIPAAGVVFWGYRVIMNQLRYFLRDGIRQRTIP
jgi:hypothetical protein